MTDQPKKSSPVVKIAVVGIIAATIASVFIFDLDKYLTLESLKSYGEDLKTFYLSHPMMSLVGFVLIYALVCALSILGATILTLAAGYIFGLGVGFATVSVASTLGATLAYNAFTMRAILDNYPLKRGSGIKARFYPANSIRQIPGVWDKITWKAAGENITLGDIENVKLRKDLNEPRIHFAIVCASIGCPNLKDKAYTADKVEAQLELESKKFVRNVDKVKVDHTKEVLYLSKIFDWFTDDFKAYTGASDYGDNAGAAAFVARYSSPATSNALLKTEYDVKWLDYDWSLNAQ